MLFNLQNALMKVLLSYVKLSNGAKLFLNLKDGHFIFFNGVLVADTDQDLKHDFCYSIACTSLELLDAIRVNANFQYESEILAYVSLMAIGGIEQNTVTILSALDRDAAILVRRAPEPYEGNLTRYALEHGVPVLEVYSCHGTSLKLLEVGNSLGVKWLWICAWSEDDEQNSQEIYEPKNRSFKIVDERSYDSRKGWINSLNKRICKDIDLFICPNQEIAERIKGLVSSQMHSKVQVLHSALRTSLIFREVLPTENSYAMRIAQISRLVPQKRIDRGITLSKLSEQHGFMDSWTIVGDGNLKSELTLIGLQAGNVFFAGFQESLHALQNADGLVQSSDYEGLPIVILEALAQGIPVFATSTGDLPWLANNLGNDARPLLVLSDLGNEEAIWHDFLNWRSQLSETWSNPLRYQYASKVQKMFSANASARIFSDLLT